MKENKLEFFKIDEAYYGGDQNWHGNWMMKRGGCSAVVACEVCIYLAKTSKRFKPLYPFDAQNVGKNDFLQFFERMFQYVYPGMGGLTSVHKFSRMLGEYVRTTGVRVKIDKMAGDAPYGDAERFVRESIDGGSPVMYLMLTHKNPMLDDFQWHWFTLTGYEETGEGLFVDFATWGKKHTFLLRELWDTRTAKRGGMARVCAISGQPHEKTQGQGESDIW